MIRLPYHRTAPFWQTCIIFIVALYSNLGILPGKGLLEKLCIKAGQGQNAELLEPVRGNAQNQHNWFGTGKQGDAPIGNCLQLEDMLAGRQEYLKFKQRKTISMAKALKGAVFGLKPYLRPDTGLHNRGRPNLIL